MMQEMSYALMRYVGDIGNQFTVKVLGSVALGIFCAMYDLTNPAREALLWLLAVDYVLGAIHAYKDERFVLRIAYMGALAKFLGAGAMLFIGQKVDIGVGLQFASLNFATLVCGVLCVNEALSAYVHLGALGVPVPEQLLVQLQRCRTEYDVDRPWAGWRAKHHGTPTRPFTEPCTEEKSGKMEAKGEVPMKSDTATDEKQPETKKRGRQ